METTAFDLTNLAILVPLLIVFFLVSTFLGGGSFNPLRLLGG